MVEVALMEWGVPDARKPGCGGFGLVMQFVWCRLRAIAGA